MRIIVAGGLDNPVLLDTTKATALLITDDNVSPNVEYKMMENGTSWVRYTKGEDKNFTEVARDLGLI